MIRSFDAENFASSETSPIAFFCSEYAITSDTSMYAGGLGILAGDFLFEAGEQKLPLIAIGLKYSKTQTTENGFEPLLLSSGKDVLVEVPVGVNSDGKNNKVKNIFFKAWIKSFSDKTFLFLLDSDLPQNDKEDRTLGDLYDKDLNIRLKQEIFLGIGGYRLIKALGIKPKKYHLNEGGTAFAALALVAEEGVMLEAARRRIVSTKHTILSIGTKIPVDVLWNTIGSYCDTYGVNQNSLMLLGAYRGDQSIFSTTRFLINLSGKSNGVSVLHTVFEKQKYPESELIPITNGVYVPRWQSSLWREAGNITSLSPKKVWEIKNKLRRDLIDEVNKISGTKLNPNVCTLVWTRRFVAYKRPLTLFTDIERLKNIVLNADKPIQIIISGEVTKNSEESLHLMEQVREAATNPIFEGKIAFVPNYSLSLAQKFVTGSDIWLNTPERGIEACGTSGMKAGLNGALMISVSDGWMDEVNWRGIGWILSDDTEDLAVSLYEALERHVVFEFYTRSAEAVPEFWVKRMISTMNLVLTNFSATKMLGLYKERLYHEEE
jgi:starch phosphorylase